MSSVQGLSEEEQRTFVLRSSPVRSFVQRRGYWLGIPIVLSGGALLCWLAGSEGVSIRESKGLLLICTIVLGHVVASCILAARTPREFQVQGGLLLARWRRREEKVNIYSLSIWRPPFYSFDGVVVLRAGWRLFVVLEEMGGFSEFLELLGLVQGDKVGQRP